MPVTYPAIRFHVKHIDICVAVIQIVWCVWFSTRAFIMISTEVCPPGFGVHSASDVRVLCTHCAVGFYKQSYANTECLLCPSGFITEAAGATSQDNCTIREYTCLLI